MVKGESLLLRLSSEDKAAIKAAADRQGLSLTTFITDAALKRAQQVQKAPAPRGVHGGVPGFFRACCHEAQQGGANGYSNAGWHLANALDNECPYDLELDEWQQEVEKLKSLLAADNTEGVWEWFERHLPKCAALIPARRRDQFVAGVRRAYYEDIINRVDDIVNRNPVDAASSGAELMDVMGHMTAADLKQLASHCENLGKEGQRILGRAEKMRDKMNRGAQLSPADLKLLKEYKEYAAERNAKP
jgi:hypothetical protein